MSFTQNWFESLAKNNFENIIKPEFVNKNINYLEIGVYEGNCMKYMFDNILSPLSKAFCIDPFENSKTHPDSYNTFILNLNNYLNRLTIIKGFSQYELSKLQKNHFDLIYVDGDHTSLAVFTDGILSFPLLKVGGIMVFDDYLWDYFNKDLNDLRQPYTGINLFCDLYKDKIEIVVKNWQIILRKLSD